MSGPKACFKDYLRIIEMTRIIQIPTFVDDLPKKIYELFEKMT